MNVTFVDGINRMLIDINTDHFFSTGGDYCCSWQADIAQADNGNGVKLHDTTNNLYKYWIVRSLY